MGDALLMLDRRTGKHGRERLTLYVDGDEAGSLRGLDGPTTDAVLAALETLGGAPGRGVSANGPFACDDAAPGWTPR